MPFPRVDRFCGNECNTEHVSAAPEGVYLGHAKFFFLLNGCTGSGGKSNPAKGSPTIGELMLEAEASTISTAESLCVVTPEVDTIIPVALSGRSRKPAEFSIFHVFAICQRRDIPLLRSFGIHDNSVKIHMLCSLQLYRGSPGIGSIRWNRKISVASSVEELRALIVVEHAQADVLIGMYFADVE